MNRQLRLLPACVGIFVVASLVDFTSIRADDWSMLGRDASRNSVSLEQNPPLTWDVGSFDRKTGRWVEPGKNIRWRADLGVGVYASPVVSDGLVWIGANSQGLEDRKDKHPAALLRCYRESDGELLYEYVSPRIKDKSQRDPPWHGLSCSPSIEGDRLWFFTNRCETVCLDIAPLKKGEGQPSVAWKTDLRELGIHLRPLWMWPGRMCSPSQPYDGRIYVTVPNGVDDSLGGISVPAPEAPSLVCLDKDTGEVVWTDNSPGANVLYSEFSSPLVAEIGGRGQVVVAQGDGWVRSFDPTDGQLLWEFDINPKTSRHTFSGGTRNYILATPVLYEDRIYIASGRQGSRGEGPGRLVCIDPTKSGDISSELAVDRKGESLPRRREQAVDPNKGEKAIANPNSGLVWAFNADAEQYEDQMHRTLSSVAVHQGLVIAPDYSGFVHCLDAKTGKKHWTYDCLTSISGSPLIVGDAVYVADEDGLISVFGLSSNPDVAMPNDEPIARIDMGSSVSMSPVFANGTLYVCDRYRLYAVQRGTTTVSQPIEQVSLGHWPQWRGPKRDNISTDTDLLKKWPESGPPLLWRVAGLGEGIASVSIAAGRVFTLGYRDEQEYVTAVSAATGEQLWMTAIGPAMAENRLMRWLGQRTPTVEGGRLYTMRSDGILVCLSVEDGRELWRKSYVKEFGIKRSYWGICDYPLVDGDKLICAPGGSKAAIVALNKRTGEMVWTTSMADSGRLSYGATVASTGGGVPEYVALLGNGLIGVDADTGRILWKYDKVTSTIANSVTPIVRGDSILAYNGYRSGRALLKLVRQGNEVKPQEVYFHAGFLDPFQDSTLWIGNNVQTFSNRGILDRYDARTGEAITRKRLAGGSASMTYADGHIYLRRSDDAVLLLEATVEDYAEKSRFTIPDHDDALGATNPVVTGGRLWLRDDDRLFCYDVRKDALDRPALPTMITLRPTKSTDAPKRLQRQPRSVFVPTPQDVVEKMLEAADVKKSDVVFDLGSGDGRIVITAAQKYECKSVGYEIDLELVELSRVRAREAGVEKHVKIEKRDLLDVNLDSADVVTVYLVPKQLEALIPQLQNLKSGARVVSHQFEIPGFKPDRTIQIESDEDGIQHNIHLWIAPLKKN